MHVSSSAGTRRSSPRAGPESVRSLRGREADGVGGMFWTAGHAPHLGLPPTSNSIFLSLRTSWPWPCAGLRGMNAYRLQPQHKPAAHSLPRGPEHRRYQQRVQSISSACTAVGASPVSPVPAPGPGPVDVRPHGAQPGPSRAERSGPFPLCLTGEKPR